MQKIVTVVSFCFVATVLSAPVKRNSSGDSGVDAVAALQRLKDGNARFVFGKPGHPHENTSWRDKLEEGQHLHTVVLGCSGSRVPPERWFDQGFGDLLVVRVAGNVVVTDVTASIEDATDHLKTELIVVMDHSECGAIAATIDHLTNVEVEPADVISRLNLIEPAVMGLDSNLSRDERIKTGVRRNFKLAVRRLSRVADLHRRIKSGKIRMVGAVGDMDSGVVEFMDA